MALPAPSIPDALTGTDVPQSFDLAGVPAAWSGGAATGGATPGPASQDDRTPDPGPGDEALPVPVPNGADVASDEYVPGTAGQRIELVGSGREGVVPGLVTRSPVAGRDGLEEVVVTPAREPAGDGPVGAEQAGVSALVPLGSGFDPDQVSQTYHVPAGTPLVRVTGAVPGLPGSPQAVDAFPPIPVPSPLPVTPGAPEDGAWFGGRVTPNVVRQTFELGRPVRNDGVNKASVWLGPDLSTRQGANLTAEVSGSVGSAEKLGAKTGPVVQVGDPGSAPNAQISGGITASVEDGKAPTVNPFVQGRLVVSPNFSVTGKQTFPLLGSPARTTIEVEGKPGETDPSESDVARLVSVPANLLNAVSDVSSGVATQLSLGSNGVCRSCAEGRLDHSLIPERNRRDAVRHLRAAGDAADTLLTDPVHSPNAANISSANNQVAVMVGQNLPRNLDRAFGEPARGAAGAVQDAVRTVPGNVDSANRQLVRLGENVAAHADRAFAQPVRDGWSTLVRGAEELRDRVSGTPAAPAPATAPAPAPRGRGALRIGDGTPEGARAANRWNRDHLGIRTNFVGNAIVGTGADRLVPAAVTGSPRAGSTGEARRSLPAAPSPALAPSAPRRVEEPSVDRAVEAARPVLRAVQQKAEEANRVLVQPLVRAAQGAWDLLTGGGRSERRR